MKYVLPESQDLVDPSFDFETERRSATRMRQRDDQYAHEVFAERISFVETRDYVRIIQRTEQIYRALYAPAVPQRAEALPASPSSTEAVLVEQQM